MRNAVLLFGLLAGCADVISDPCDPPKGERHWTLDGTGRIGFSALDVAAVVDGTSWNLVFAPQGDVDGVPSFETTLTLHVQPTGPGDEFDVADDPFEGISSCDPGRHLRVPVDVQVSTSAGTFARQPDPYTSWIDATSLDTSDLHLIGALFPNRNPFVDVKGSCWAGLGGVTDLELSSDEHALGFFPAGAIAAPHWVAAGRDPAGVTCAGAGWEGRLAAPAGTEVDPQTWPPARPGDTGASN